MTKENKIQFIVCPECGEGKEVKGTCNTCRGLMTGAFYKGWFLYSGFNVSDTVIAFRRLKIKVDLFVNLISMLIGLCGLMFLGVWIWNTGEVGGDYGMVMNFYNERSVYLLIFWLSVIFDMFVIFRLSREKEMANRIDPELFGRSWDMNNEQEVFPNNWVELVRYKKKIDVSKGLSLESLATLEDAYLLAEKLGDRDLNPLHLFFSSLKNNMVAALFSRLTVNGDDLATRTRNQLLKSGHDLIKGEKIRIPLKTKQLLIEAYYNVAKMENKIIDAVDLVLACHTHDEMIKEILYDLEVDDRKLTNALAWFNINEKIIDNYKIYRKMARYKPDTNMDRAYTAVATHALDHYSTDLTRMAKWGRLSLCVARDEEIGKIFEKFESGHTGVILVGEPGTGKTSIIYGIAQLMVKEDVPPVLKDKRLVELDVARLVSGANASEAQERLLVVIDEVAKSGNIMLFIKNIETIVGIKAGEEESLELSDVLLSAIEKKYFYCIASTDPMSFKKYLENNPIGREMAKLEIDEPEDDKAMQIIESKIGFFEGKYGSYFTYNAIDEALDLTKKYIHDKFLPAKAIEVLESAAIRVARHKGKDAVVTKNDVGEIVSEITSIPVDKITADENEVLLNLEAKIHDRMIGQEEAVKMIAESLRRARAEMRDEKRPIASFLFLGPTGVGKTELAKTVAEVYFGNETNMIRVDMSEYQSLESITRMIGNNDGGLGIMTEAVRNSPFSLVLLDEFEKAHPEILNLFLQIMDDGRVTDGQGRVIDFTNCIIIATSNAGAHFIADEIKKGTTIEEIRQSLVNEQLNKFMRPELINRFDGVIVFRPLTEEDIVTITKLMLNKLRTMLEDKGISLFYKDEGVKVIAHAGFDPKFGARPLRRVIQDRIENNIAKMFLEGVLERRDTVVIDNDGSVKVEKAKEL